MEKCKLLQVRLLATDYERLVKLADSTRWSLAQYARRKLGVDDPPLGGARNGAGRPRKEAQ